MILAVHLTNRFFKKVKKTRTRDFERNSKGIPFKFGIKILLLTLLPVIFFFFTIPRLASLDQLLIKRLKATFKYTRTKTHTFF